MKTRFDFEQEIMQVWGLSEDLNILFEQVCDGDIATDEDRLANFVLGLKTLHDYRCQRLFDTFETMIKNGQIT